MYAEAGGYRDMVRWRQMIQRSKLKRKQLKEGEKNNDKENKVPQGDCFWDLVRINKT